MQTYTFDELNKRGKDYVWFNYWPELKPSPMHTANAILIFRSWRFNEHGERIA